MARISIDEIVRILQNHSARGEVSPAENNSVLLLIMEKCCRLIDREAQIDESGLLKVCKAGFQDILTAGAKNASERYKNQFGLCQKEANQLEERINIEKDELAELDSVRRRNFGLQRELKDLTVKIAEYRAEEEALRKDLATLRSFGVAVNEEGEFDFVTAEGELQSRLERLETDSGTMRTLAEKVIRAKNRFNSDQIACADALLSTLSESEKALSALSDETVSKVEALAEKLKEKKKLLEDYRVKIISATTEIKKTEEELDRYIKAFGAHRAENDSLYRLLERIGADDFRVLREQIATIDGALDRAIKPYDELLARLCAKRQEEIDATVERIETDFGVSLSSHNGNGQNNP